MDKEFNIKDLVEEINFDNNFIGYRKNDIILTNKEISIMDMYNIDYKSLSSMSELLYVIDDVIEDNDSSELEEIAKDISDRNYYLNSRK